MKSKIRQIKLFLITLRGIIPLIWKLSVNYNSLYIHWHLTYGWSWKDYNVQWKELHKAHLIYARKLNRKYGKKLYFAGRTPRK
jgi:hypothetical protein